MGWDCLEQLASTWPENVLYRGAEGELCAALVLCPPSDPQGSEVALEAEEQALFGLYQCVCRPSTALGTLAFSARPKGHVLLLLRMGNAAGNRRGMSEGVTCVPAAESVLQRLSQPHLKQLK